MWTSSAVARLARLQRSSSASRGSGSDASCARAWLPIAARSAAPKVPSDRSHPRFSLLGGPDGRPDAVRGPPAGSPIGPMTRRTIPPMRARSRLVIGLGLVLLGLVVAACADEPESPPADEASSVLRQALEAHSQGDLDGAAGLRFMGVLAAEHNYRPKIF